MSSCLQHFISVTFREIRECLKLDPDHKECFPFYKKVKKLVKQMDSALQNKANSNWEDCITKAKAMLKTEPSVWNYVFTGKPLSWPH